MRLAPGDAFAADAFPVSRTCDAAGWFASTAADLAEINNALVGSRTGGREPRGVYLDYGTLDAEVRNACASAANNLCHPADDATRHGLESVFLGGAPTYAAVTGVEVAEVHAAWLDTHRERYSPPVWQRIDAGRRVDEQTLIRAKVHQQSIRTILTSYFLTFDFLVLPAVPCPALTKAECTPENRTRMLELCAPATLARLPVLTLPVPLPSGLSAGLQVIVPDATSPAISQALDCR
jgi:Asp-tRNA(Asn)/Glu-tRNA(Gln) amidotransferase A subunit family amidase